MTNAERKAKFDELAAKAQSIKEELERLTSELTPLDLKVTNTIITDMVWSNENLTVLGQHAIGDNLQDTMGIEVCEICGGPLPDERRTDCVFCSTNCRNKNARMKQSRARQMYKGGCKNLVSIALEVGCTYATVERWINKLESE